MLTVTMDSMSRMVGFGSKDMLTLTNNLVSLLNNQNDHKNAGKIILSSIVLNEYSIDILIYILMPLDSYKVGVQTITDFINASLQ